MCGTMYTPRCTHSYVHLRCTLTVYASRCTLPGAHFPVYTSRCTLPGAHLWCTLSGTLLGVHFRCTIPGVDPNFQLCIIAYIIFKIVAFFLIWGIFILDECDKMLESLGMLISNILVYNNISLACVKISNTSLSDMRTDMQEIFKMTPHDKQVIMFPETLSKDDSSRQTSFVSQNLYTINFNFVWFISVKLNTISLKLNINNKPYLRNYIYFIVSLKRSWIN